MSTDPWEAVWQTLGPTWPGEETLTSLRTAMNNRKLDDLMLRKLAVRLISEGWMFTPGIRRFLGPDAVIPEEGDEWKR